MRVLSLFSGGGLGDYGLTLAGMEIVGQVEIDEYCQKILALRWPDVPKWKDIKNVTGKEVLDRCGRIDLVSGGFPCQPFSVAGEQRGEEDERNLWPEMHRIICEVRPKWVLAENVPGLLSIDDGRIIRGIYRDLSESGYDFEWNCLPSRIVGAPQRRWRLWIVAYPKGKRLEGYLFDWKSLRIIESETRTEFGDRSISSGVHFGTLDKHLRVGNGRSEAVDGIKILGNGQVPSFVEWIGKQIMKFEDQRVSG